MRGAVPASTDGRRAAQTKKTRLGHDLAGQVEAVGKNVTQFKPGDEVFGVARHDSGGVCVCARERALVIKPANVTFEQAACVGLAGFTALQGLRTGKIQPGQKVLINGASGGVGTFAVQIAKAFGAEVTAVCSTEQGRSYPINRRGSCHRLHQRRLHQERATLRPDLRQRRQSFACRTQRILTPNGICVLAGIGGAGLHEGQLSRIGGNFTAFLASRFSRQKFQMYRTTTKQEDLAVLRDLMATGKVTPVIDRTYKLSETAEAMRYLEEGHARGKIVIAIE